MTHQFFHYLHQINNVLFKRGYLWIGWIVILTWLSLMPTKGVKAGREGLDKILHLTFYATLAFLSNYQEVFLEHSRLKAWMVFLFCTLYGIGIEIIQGTLIEERYFELWDLIANIIGIIIGIIVSNFFFK